MSSNLHIVIACSRLDLPAGYEKAMITAANLFVQKGHRVTLLVLDQTAETYFRVDPAVQIMQRPLNFGITEKGNPISRKIRLWTDTRVFRKLVKQLRPDHLVCTEYQIAAGAILAGAGACCKVYAWEHHHYGAREMNRFWTRTVRWTYPKMDAIICLNADEQRHYLGLNDRSIVIPNFILPPESPADLNAKKEFGLLSVTRFNHLKGIDLLMQVAKEILPKNPQLKWKVIGYGEEEPAFLDFIRRENLSAQLVCQTAPKTDLTDEYRNASLFVLPSRNECFPLVLLEAMSNGLPCIAFDCDTGPRHIIRPGETGLLIGKENTAEMADAITGLLADEERKKKMQVNALTTIRDYHPDRIYGFWERLFSK